MQHRHGQTGRAATPPPAGADSPACPDRALAVVNNGETVRLCRIEGGRGLQARLAAMGLIPGANLTMVRNSSWGPCIVAVRDSRVMIGHGMADRVLVR